MKITFEKAGKRFNREWIFRHLDHVFETGQHTVILGGNGSGKSTLLQAISGFYTLSEGKVTFELDGTEIPIDQVFRHVSLATPYLDLYEDLTLIEAIRFQQQFKAFRNGLKPKSIAEIMELEHTKKKAIKHFSSGMKQRVRLALAILADTPILLLDEPTSNLDHNAIAWYQKLVQDNLENRLVVVASNEQEQEYPFCQTQLRVEDFKPSR